MSLVQYSFCSFIVFLSSLYCLSEFSCSLWRFLMSCFEIAISYVTVVHDLKFGFWRTVLYLS